MIKVGINGFGRIGRLVYRKGLYSSLSFEVVNDISDIKTLAHLLKYDSVHGPLGVPIEIVSGVNRMFVGTDKLDVWSEKDPENLPWQVVDIVAECTGKNRGREKVKPFFEMGVKKVLISAPTDKAEDADAHIVLGVNDSTYDPEKHHIVTIGSCTTNCLAPVAKVLNDNFGIVKGFMTTIHAYTNDQNLQDAPHKDLRRARAAGVSMIPTTTGAAKAISLIIPDLKGKLDGIAVRVPVINGSLLDLVVETEKPITKESVNSAFKDASMGPMGRYLEYTDDPLVSVDVIGNPHSAVFDALSTMVVGKHFVKVLAFYDNEWAFSVRMVEMMEKMAQSL